MSIIYYKEFNKHFRKLCTFCKQRPPCVKESVWILTLPFKILLCSLIFIKGAHLKNEVSYSNDSCSSQQKI